MTPTNFKTYFSKLWAIPVVIALALLFFKSIWFAYSIGLLIVALKASIETKRRLTGYLTESRSPFDGLTGEVKLEEAAGVTFKWLLAYTALFVFLIIPIVYSIHTKTDIKLLSRDAERYIESIIEDGSDKTDYAPIDY